MEWILSVGHGWLVTLAWLAGLAAAFGVLVRLMPCNPGMYWWKDLRGVATDAVYWFIVPLFLHAARTAMLVAGVMLLYGGRDPQLLPVRNLPLWLQCVMMLLIQDVLLYWIHRVFHSGWAWKFHAIHHSPAVLDWMATARFHPVNNLLSFGLADVVVLLLGFSPAALFALVPFNIIYSAMVHANLNWTFGPLRYVLASPVFHRWHHTTEAEGLDKNFASTFSFLDLAFGTYYLPPGKLPEHFGNGEHDFPEGFCGQLLYPFKKKRVRDSLAGEQEAPSESQRRREVAVTLLAAGALGVGGWLASRAFFDAAPAGKQAAPAEEPEQARLEKAQAALARHPLPVDARQATAVLAVAVSADGRTVVSGHEDGTIHVWDADGRPRFTLTGHLRPVRGVAVSADAKRIVSGSYDRTVRVWDAQTRQVKHTLTGHAGFVLSVAVSADASRIVSASADGVVKLWDGVTGKEQLTLSRGPGAVPGVAISADGRRVVSASWATAKVWDAETGREECTLQGHDNLVYSVAISGDGTRIVTGSFDETVKVWDAEGHEEATLKGHQGPVYSVAISADGRHVVSGGKDRAVKVWDSEGHPKDLAGHKDAVTGVAVSADAGRIISGSQDGTLRAQICNRPVYGQDYSRARQP
jgi:sterol desaturase/sphingolipid hydroxylase (fatty acid hydroxylase superfamily)